MSTWLGTLIGKVRQRSEPRTRKGRRNPTVAIKSVDASVAFDGHLLDPTMRVVVVEDVCWRAATEYWRSRRPAPWRIGARRQWRAEGVALRDKRDRIRGLMDESTQDFSSR